MRDRLRQAARPTLGLLSVVSVVAPPLGAQVAPGRPPPELDFEGSAVELHMPNEVGRPLVDVRADGIGPYAFFIDTGSSVTVVDRNIANSLGLEVVGSERIGAPGGDRVEADRVLLPPLRVGALTVRGATALVLDISDMTNGVMQGILGMDLFHSVLLTLDPAQSRAVVRRGQLVRGAPGVVETSLEGGQMRFPIEVAGQTVLAHIDHGSPSTFTLGAEWLDELPTVAASETETRATLVGGTRTIRSRDLVGDLRFAGRVYQEPRLSFMDPSPGTANIGFGVLRHLVVTLDAANARIAFLPADPSGQSREARAQTPRNVRTLGVEFRGRNGEGFREIVRVLPGSLAEGAGMQAGDEVISLNGRAMREYTQPALQALIGGTEPLQWEIARDGEIVVVVIR